MKKCSKCEESKELSGFYKNKSCKDGLSHWCKVCIKRGMKEYHGSKHGKATHNAYMQSERGKVVSRLADEKFRQSEHHKEYIKTYKKTHRATLRGYLYDRWVNMCARCNNPQYKLYKYYGAKGTKVLFSDFAQFFEYITVTLGFTSVDELRLLAIHRVIKHYAPDEVVLLTRAEHIEAHRQLSSYKVTTR